MTIPFLQYYILRDTRVSLIKMETINSAVRHLRHNDEYIYAATDSEVDIIHGSTEKPLIIIIL